MTSKANRVSAAVQNKAFIEDNDRNEPIRNTIHVRVRPDYGWAVCTGCGNTIKFGEYDDDGAAFTVCPGCGLQHKTYRDWGQSTTDLFLGLTFAQTLRAWRAVHQLKQNDAAEYLGYGLGTIFEWEAEKREPKEIVKQAILEKLAAWKGAAS